MTEYQVKPSHGGCLTAWLVVSGLAAIGAAVLLLGVVETASRVGRGWVIYVFIGLLVLQLVSIYGYLTGANGVFTD